MSHHYSGPQLGFPCGDPRLDFCDLYAFPKPGDPSKSILVMNVHPSSTVNVDLESKLGTELTTSIPFRHEAIYEICIDTNSDSIADLTYRFLFSPFTSGAQTATMRVIKGRVASVDLNDGEPVIENAAVSLDEEARIAEGHGHRLFAGWRSDPFFFDPSGAFNGLNFSNDFFADKDICSIVIELSNSALGSGKVGVWARTVARTDNGWTQVDRGALAAQSVFLTNDRRDDYLATEPVDDGKFLGTFAHSLEHTGGYAPDAAKKVAETLLPDILPFEAGKAASYPKNGRTLTDDVMGPFVSILTNGRVTSHGLRHHEDLLSDFPYVGPPHKEFAARPDVSA